MKSFAACWAVVMLLLPAAPTIAQDFTGKTVHSVSIQGLVRVSEQLVRAQLEVQPGQTYSANAIARDIRRLSDLGHFRSIQADAQPAGEQVDIAYIVEEKQVIEDLKIIGNDKLNARQIRSVLQSREGDSFNADAYNQERDAVLKLYQSKGFPNASVDVTVEDMAPGRVRMTYMVSEGRKARIHKVRFVGNSIMSQRALRKLMKTKKSWWFLGGKYDEAKFEADLANITNAYGNHGRLEAEVTKTEFNYDQSGKDLEVTVYISEGAEYKVETLDVSNNVAFDADEIVETTDIKVGEVHNKGQVEGDAAQAQKLYTDAGYVNAKVEPQVTMDRENKTTHVVQRVTEGSLKYIREITITGNAVTKDEVIRRQMQINPGDRYDGSELRLSERSLNNLRYFDSVRFSLEDVENSDWYSTLNLDVEETKTSEFSFGGGYGSDDGFGGFVNLDFSNFDILNFPTFSGGGQQLSFRVFGGQRQESVRLAFTDPEFAGYPLSFGTDLYSEYERIRGGIEYDIDSIGGQIRFGKVLSPYVKAKAAFAYNESELQNLDYRSPVYLRREQDRNSTISTIWGIERDTVDSNRDPSSGSSHEVTVEIAGLGGDNNFVQLDHDSMWYLALDESKKWVASFRSRQGWINEYGDSDYVPINYRYFAGGTNTVRGYKLRSISPQERRYGFFGEEDSVGGELRFLQNIEMRYKLTELLRLYTFFDSGGVWADAGDFSWSDMKYSVGLGIGVDVPRFGPIRVDYGFPLNSDEEQGSGRLHFTTGFRF